MQLKLDKTKTYAIALEGGGAKGGYEIGVWQALDEEGIRFNAVSGTSVGALNGALYAMGDLDKAESVWSSMELSKVIAFPNDNIDDLHRIVSGDFELKDLKDLAPEMLGIVRNKGLDVAPLRKWVREVVEPQAVRESKVDLYVTAIDLTEKKRIAPKINDMDDETMWDMLLASSYHPTFKLEKLGGKFYADGGFVDSLPITPLLDAGYKNIIAVRLPSNGHQKYIHPAEDVRIHYVKTADDLGSVLNFDSEQACRDMKIGYYDCKRMLFGLSGKKYYFERLMTQRDAMNYLVDYYFLKDRGVTTLREIAERRIPAEALAMGQLSGDYYELLTALAEYRAVRKGMERFKIYTDREFFDEALK